MRVQVGLGVGREGTSRACAFKRIVTIVDVHMRLKTMVVCCLIVALGAFVSLLLFVFEHVCLKILLPRGGIRTERALEWSDTVVL